jgi:2-amino-4-hydroxy-6-hydroxymethyldihydropteridine diphosphokinase
MGAAIFVGLGANLPFPGLPGCRATCGAALAALRDEGADVRRRSRWYRSAPIPASDQPWHVNAAVELGWAGSAQALLELLHRLEARFGRRRGPPGAPRTLDLDLLAFGGEVRTAGEGPLLPHPRLHERAFVLLPLCDLAPGWRHPVLGRTARELLAALPPGQAVEVLADGPGLFGTEWTGEVWGSPNAK